MDPIRISGLPIERIPGERGLLRALAHRASGSDSPLTQEERALIARYFPEAPTGKLTVYGPRQVQELRPDALGRHLDLKG
ncbi:MAG: hypothetical protein N2561_02445 [Bacteroidetes bacterium]|nr:hypothetical protein [Rhodothermia bacterium]MCS7154662.1 hypothetical protein [Bacteroidota bacterium]MCX7906379.1 hypothetical protein [Bacteroidota bacterium]MDW8137455.1 hypothetical protein [Bacteroidota bacterium]MDW8285591.1 hypothetical protein [Bacteroidota bacterium]